ncbi:unnamed protein product [Sphagnum jensenii]|uniref:V-type proton ATPase subunit a n=1 Tax=Sphagnum jensenii TaxID=128206 RepID=A0ABP1BHU3_9BRYO
MVRMDLFRSEEMSKVQLIMPAESAHDTITYLAEIGHLMFKDLNPQKSPFQQTYANKTKQCADMARKLNFFQDQLVKAQLVPAVRPLTDADEIDFEELEMMVDNLEVELLEINNNSQKLQQTVNELNELAQVLQKTGSFFSSAWYETEVRRQSGVMSRSSIHGEDRNLPLLLEQEMQTDPSKHGNLGFITGAVSRSKFVTFERIIFRATRGNMFLKSAAIEQPIIDPATGDKIEKTVFIVFFAGNWSRIKITKICDAFGANRYHFPEDAREQRQMISEVRTRLVELQTTLNVGMDHRDNVLTSIGYNLDHWIVMVQREKAVYHTLNMLSVDVTHKCLVAEGWCPVTAKPKIQDALHRAAFDCNAQVNTIFQVLQTKESPPTFHEVNKFTSAFQEIVSAYGVARYQEVNPGCFTIVTFPFLFAVMFGDWAHGIVMMVASFYLICNEKKFESKKLGDIMEMVFGGRYIILLMSFFSIYTGLIYNEFLSVPFSFWTSAYQCRDPTCSDAHSAGLIKWSYNPYPFGVDPAWHGSRSELPFLNSMKMKMSILMGITQMNLGVILSWWNAKFFHNKLDIWYQFVPQLLFLNALFGYLSILILIKWCQGSKADLYHVIIYMFLSPGSDLGEDQLFWGQSNFQVMLVLLAIVAVPWMLFPKPFKLQKLHLQKVQGRAYGVLGGSDTDSIDLEHEHDEDENFDLSEVLVHQMIHTIEFVLGAVSNTASYLRLWALSLAHSQLSSVFYNRILLLSFSYSNPLIRGMGLFTFACATVMVLLIMETLSAFLHALRLHWVEFQNKFYTGDGYMFNPLSIQTLVHGG